MNAVSGFPLPGARRYDLATRPEVRGDPLEGASLVRREGFYYLFVSIDYCCNSVSSTNNYKQAVGRSTTAQGPFLDMQGTPMMSGGGTVLLQGDDTWNAPGGGTAFLDAETGESLFAFHALHTAEAGRRYLWIKRLVWNNNWPAIE